MPCNAGYAGAASRTSRSAARTSPATRSNQDRLWHLSVCIRGLGQGVAAARVPRRRADANMEQARQVQEAANGRRSRCALSGHHGPKQHLYCAEPLSSYADMMEYIETVVGCKMKGFEDMCSLAHYSPGVARGGRFSSFKCACCGYSPTEKQWRWDLAKFEQLSDDAQHTKRQQHNEVGTADR
eukprot:5992019-Pleurochrysis_carterae.AAC.1